MKQNYSRIVKYFYYLVKGTLFKNKNKTNIKFKISNFNKYIIATISILFLFLFYLSIPTLYDKTWVQNTIEKKLLEEFKINFSMSSDISYNILPAPHFLIKNSKIFKSKTNNHIAISDVKKLKVFISKKNFFNKDKININEILIIDANLLLNQDDLITLNKRSDKKFSNKKIKIKKSNIFFKDEIKKTIAIIKIPEAIFFNDDLNLLNLKGEIFNIPFIMNFSNQTFFPTIKKINIVAKKLKLNILNESIRKTDKIINGFNVISILNTKIYTQYEVKKNSLVFNSDNSKTYNPNIDYNGKLLLKPFDLELDVNIKRFKLFKLFKLFNNNSIFNEFFKTKLLFNENISANISINAILNDNDGIFNNATFNLNIANGIINIDHMKLVNDKIGFLKTKNSSLLIEKDRLILNTDIVLDIKNTDNLFFFLNTPKRHRKIIKNILLNLKYDFLTNQISFNKLIIDDVEANDKILSIIDQFNDNNANNLNNSRRILNKIFSVYEG